MVRAVYGRLVPASVEEPEGGAGEGLHDQDDAVVGAGVMNDRSFLDGAVWAVGLKVKTTIAALFREPDIRFHAPI